MLLFMDGGSAISIKYSIMSDVCKTATTKTCKGCRSTSFCSIECQQLVWKKHKKTCKAPTTPPATEADPQVWYLIS